MAAGSILLYDTMALHTPNSPFIKNEPDDISFDPNRYISSVNGGGADVTQQNGQDYAPWQAGNSRAINIGMNGNNMQHPFGSGQNLSSSFMQGNSAITDDDLIGSLDPQVDRSAANQQPQPFSRNGGVNSNSFSQPMHQSVSQQQHFNVYSNTPDGAPIQSPFDNGNFDYSQWQPTQTNHAPSHHPMQATRSMSGQEATSRSPMSPMTPGMNNLHLGSSANSNFSGQHVPGRLIQRGHQHSLSGQWDSSIGSGYSHFDSPLSSPSGPMHPQITEVLKTGTPTSPQSHPTRSSKPTSSAEMKKAKRRASHNEVERRRRNHINDQITHLAVLVPQHRLDDEAIKRSMNSSMTNPLGLGVSSVSPSASAGLGGAAGRRTSGGMPLGAGADDKDKGPAKGDVLNGAVGWTQDLLWMMSKMMAREQEMQHTLAENGLPLPAPPLDEEQRMRSELQSAFRAASQNPKVHIERYSRRHGTHLFVPGHTNHAGEPVTPNSHSELSPPILTTDSQSSNNGVDTSSQQFWGFPNSNMEFKEEDTTFDDLDMN